MAEYSISYTKSAAKSFKNIHKQDLLRIKQAIEKLALDPYPPGYIKIVGGEGELRIRVGNYRVIYEVNDGQLIVLVLSVGHRREIYR